MGRTVPVLTVAVGRSAAGKLLAGARAAKVATPLVTRKALFEQAGIIAAANFGELNRHRGAAGRPARARRDQGRRSVQHPRRCGAFRPRVQRRAPAGRQPRCHILAGAAGMLGRDALVAGPVDTTLLVTPALFRQCLELVGADPGVDMVLALTATTAGGDLVSEMGTARLRVPIAAAVMDQVEAVRLLPGRDEGSPAIPAYAYAESAARALGHAARYGTWAGIPRWPHTRPRRAYARTGPAT